MTYVVTPRLLLPLDRTRVALVSLATIPVAGYPDEGLLDIAYLARRPNGFRLLHHWPAAMLSGSFGTPANGGLASHRFGGAPLVFATTQVCGMDSCAEWFDILRLDRHPHAFGPIDAGGTWPTEFPSDLFSDDKVCPGHDYHATIGPPPGPGALFSVRYDGWLSPPGKPQPRTALHRVVDAVLHGGALVPRPRFDLPDCER